MRVEVLALVRHRTGWAFTAAGWFDGEEFPDVLVATSDQGPWSAFCALGMSMVSCERARVIRRRREMAKWN